MAILRRPRREKERGMPKEGAYRSSDISVKPLQSYQLSLEPGSTGGGVGQNPCVKSGAGSRTEDGERAESSRAVVPPPGRQVMKTNCALRVQSGQKPEQRRWNTVIP